jgi:UDP-3-O-[3-hydroxymyristoyl] glucosamine N-acyltransferase
VKRGAAKGRSGRRGAAARRPARSPFTLAEVAKALGGVLAAEPDLLLTGVQPLDRAGPGDLSWIAEERHSGTAARSRAGALLVSIAEHAAGRPAVIVGNPAVALAAWLAAWAPPERPRPGVARGAFVSRTARIGRGASVAAGATVENGARVGARTVIGASAFVGREAEIGEDCLVYPGAVVLDRCRVGNRCILYPGAVIGSDGFGYAWDGQRHRKIPQIGIARLEDEVEVGAHSTVDRATLGETVIRRGTKIDNLVMVAHNVEIGEHSIVCAQVGIAGSTSVGKGVTLAGQVGISDHAVIEDRAILTGQAGIARGARVPAGAALSGMPAMPHREFLKSSALFQRLPELARRLEALAKRVEALAKGGGPWSSESAKS